MFASAGAPPDDRTLLLVRFPQSEAGLPRMQARRHTSVDSRVRADERELKMICSRIGPHTIRGLATFRRKMEHWQPHQ